MADWDVDFSAGANGSGSSGSPWNRWTDTQAASVGIGDAIYVRGRCMTTTNKAQFGANSFTNLPINCTIATRPGFAPPVFSAVCDLPTTGWVNVTGNQWRLAGATVLALLNNATVGTGAGLSLAGVANVAAAVNEITYEAYAAAADAGTLDANAQGAPMCFFGKDTVANTATVAWAAAVDTNGDVYVNIPGGVSPNATYAPDWSKWFTNNAGAVATGLPTTLPRISLVLSSGGTGGNFDWLRFTTSGMRWNSRANGSFFAPSEDIAGYIFQITSGNNNVIDGVTATCAAYHCIGATSGDNVLNVFRNCDAKQTCRSNGAVSTSVLVAHASGAARNATTRDRQVRNVTFYNCNVFGSDLLSAARTGAARSGPNATLGCDLIYCHGDAGSSRVNSVYVVGGKWVMGNIAGATSKWATPGSMSDQTWSVTAAGSTPQVPQHHNVWMHNVHFVYTNLAANTTQCPRLTASAFAYTNCHFNLDTPGNTVSASPDAGGGLSRGMVSMVNSVLFQGCLFTGKRNSYHIWFDATATSGNLHENFRKCTFAFESQDTTNFHFLFGFGVINLAAVNHNIVLRGCVIDMNMTKAALFFADQGYSASTGTLANVVASFSAIGNTYLTPSGANWQWFARSTGVASSLAIDQAGFTTNFEVKTEAAFAPNYQIGARNAGHFDTQAAGCRPLAGCVLTGVPSYSDIPLAHPIIGQCPTGLGTFDGVERGCWPITPVSQDVLTFGATGSGLTPRLAGRRVATTVVNQPVAMGVALA